MSDVVRRHYDQQPGREWARLDRPYRRLERVTTRHLIDRYFPRRGRITDIGAGPGRYALELLRMGYEVTLVDLSSAAVAFAEKAAQDAGLSLMAAHCADACDLSVLPDHGFDGGLCMGPLYHIVDPDRRQKALRQLRRVLKPGAPAIIAFLNPWGILRSGLYEFPGEYADLDHVRGLLRDWVQCGEQEAFTEAVFLTPPQALTELEQAGFTVVSRAGAEAFAAGMHSELERMAEEMPAAYENALKLAAETCELPQFRDCTEHQHIVVRA